MASRDLIERSEFGSGMNGTPNEIDAPVLPRSANLKESRVTPEMSITVAALPLAKP